MTPSMDFKAATRRNAGADAPIVLHDIRNHLNAVGGVVELMSGGVLHLGTHDAVDVARQSIEAILAKLELLQCEPSVRQAEGRRRGEVECIRFASRLCAAFSLMARQQGATLSFLSADKALPAMVDALALDRVLTNLLVNAIRHSGASEIEVSVRREASAIVFLVRDNGVGLPERVKQAFRQLQSGLPAASGDARHGLRSCLQCAALTGARLRLVTEWSPGVCWELALSHVEAASWRHHADGLKARTAELVDL